MTRLSDQIAGVAYVWQQNRSCIFASVAKETAPQVIVGNDNGERSFFRSIAASFGQHARFTCEAQIFQCYKLEGGATADIAGSSSRRGAAGSPSSAKNAHLTRKCSSIKTRAG